MEAIVLAGGFGTRLSHIVSNVPKPMAPVAGKPFLEYILDDLVENGITHIILAVHHKKESIINYFGDYFKSAIIDYSIEKVPLKTGGAIKQGLSFCREDRVLVVNGDTFYKVPYQRMHQFSIKKGKMVTIAVKEMANFSRYGKIDINGNGVVTAFHEKEFCSKGYINGGVYDIARSALDLCPDTFSIEDVYFPTILAEEEIQAFPCNNYFVDIGVPEDYQKAQKDFLRVNML